MSRNPLGAPGTPEPGAIEFVDLEPLSGFTVEEAYKFLADAPITSLTAASSPEEYTTGMIALIPSDADARRISAPGGEILEQLHLTLFYLGEMELISEEQRMALVQAITRVLSGAEEPIEANAFGVAVWNPQGEDPAIVLNVGGKSLEDVYEDIEDAIDEVGLALPENFCPWVPHVCLEYTSDFTRIIELLDRVGPITFDRVRIAFAGEYVDIPLSADLSASGYDQRKSFSRKAPNMGETSFGAVGSHQTGTSNNSWDGPANEKKLPSPMTVETARNFYAWIDESAVSDGEMPKVAGRFGHHEVGSNGRPGAANIRACQSGIGVLHGGRGGTTIPASDKRGVYNHLAAHIRDAGLEPPPFEVVTAAGAETNIAAVSGGTAWEGVLVVEGSPTGDGRQFAEGAITWADLPIPLRWNVEDSHGGQPTTKAVLVGRIDKIWRNPDNPMEIWGSGVFDDDGVHGAEALRLVRGGFLRGVSVDPDDIKDADVELIFPEDQTDGEGESEDDTELDDVIEMFAMPELTVFHAGRLRAATLVDIPAFVEAQIWLAGTRRDETMIASAGLLDVEVIPPAELFTDPQLESVTPMTIFERPDGLIEIFGHGSDWTTCHTSYADTCMLAPHEESHDYFRLGEMVCADGSIVSVGTITMGIGHAPTTGLSAKQAAEHYDNVNTAVAYVASGNDDFGLWYHGIVRPGLSSDRLQTLRAAGAVSGDWRRIGGALRLVAFLVVNHPGFPIPRTTTFMAKKRQLSLVAAGVVRPSISEKKGLNVDNAVKRIARSIGRDPEARIKALSARIKGVK